MTGWTWDEGEVAWQRRGSDGAVLARVELPRRGRRRASALLLAPALPGKAGAFGRSCSTPQAGAAWCERQLRRLGVSQGAQVLDGQHLHAGLGWLAARVCDLQAVD